MISTTRCGTADFAGRSRACTEIEAASVASEVPLNGRAPNRHSQATTQNAN